jgi:hypothetical protein
MEINRSPAYEEIGPTQRLTFTEQPLPRSSAKTARLIAELGLRYRPTAQADLEAHAATLALLTKDLAGVNPDDLERAIHRWARTEKWMPKASELIETIQSMDVCRRELSAETLAARRNSAPDMRPDLIWVAVNGQLKLEPR